MNKFPVRERISLAFSTLVAHQLSSGHPRRAAQVPSGLCALKLAKAIIAPLAGLGGHAQAHALTQRRPRGWREQSKPGQAFYLAQLAAPLPRRRAPSLQESPKPCPPTTQLRELDRRRHPRPSRTLAGGWPELPGRPRAWITTRPLTGARDQASTFPLKAAALRWGGGGDFFFLFRGMGKLPTASWRGYLKFSSRNHFPTLPQEAPGFSWVPRDELLGNGC